MLTETTADLAFALLLAVARRLSEGDDYVRQGRWQTWGPLLLLGRTSTARRWASSGSGGSAARSRDEAGGFGMRIVYHDSSRARSRTAGRSARRTSLDELLAAIVISCAST